jgi:hypothetical protein
MDMQWVSWEVQRNILNIIHHKLYLKSFMMTQIRIFHNVYSPVW